MKCPRCGKSIHDSNGLRMHCIAKHGGRMDQNPAVIRHGNEHMSMADLFIEAGINRSMGVPNEDWIEDMLP